ncbi:hypothetical protein BF503P2_00052 [Bacteroides phage BF503P2]|nr:hypothetical protein BF503P2_00052 [Bacteroides phage BF503P2]
MEAEIKSLSEMPFEHKKRVFSAWEQMTYKIVKRDARIRIFNINTVQEKGIRMSVKIFTDCNNYENAVNELTKAFVNCLVQFTVSYVDDARGGRYVYIIAEA